ncbi:PKD domain-containing protein [Luteococcus peritonei]|uniref:PKD domain-containing protein n=1 Tax=Luteococcus peritonei TaxID=88874 RepID=A0ABW4RUD6_9ACTN
MSPTTIRRRLRGAAGLAVTGAMALGALLAAVPAQAVPSDYEVIERRSTGVTSDALPTTQIDGVAWDQKIAGGRVFVGGEFATARPAGAAPGTSLSPRANLLAYDISTGVLDEAFRADTDAAVNVLALSPDSTRLYVGGAFTSLAGQKRYRIAAINTADGSLVADFAPRLDASVNAIVVTDQAVYVGGVFSTANGVGRTRLAAFSPTDGALLGWAPTANRNVKAMTITPDGSRVVVGGQFSTVNGAASPGTASIDAVTGTLYPFALNQVVRNGTANTGVYSLTQDGTNIIGTAFNYGEGLYEGVFMVEPVSGAIRWLADCHGDSYDATAMGGQVYSVSHHHNCSNVGSFPQFTPDVYKRADAWTYEATGTVRTNSQSGYSNFAGQGAPSQVDWYPDLAAGSYTGQSQAAWTSENDGTYLVLGGEFPKVNGAGQQGLVRFAVPGTAPSKDGPVVGGSSLVPTINAKGTTAALTWKSSWDRDNMALSYQIYRDDRLATPLATVKGDSLWWDRPTMGYVDTTMVPGKTYTYWIWAVDGDGNRVRGNNVTVTAGEPVPADLYYGVAMAASPSHYWRLSETSGSFSDTAGATPLTAYSGITRGQPGILAGDAAALFGGGTSGYAAATIAEAAPASYTSEVWIRTTSTSGGMILDFGNRSSGTSTLWDRTLSMTSDGRLAMDVLSGGVRRAVVSTTSHNDGGWHHVATSLSGSGMKLYVDGSLVASDAGVTSARAFTGYWRLGGDSVTGMASAPASRFFKGSIDEVAVHPTELSAETIREHARTGGAPVANTAPVAAFTSSCTGDSCSFDATGSSDAEGEVTSWEWTFGDGTTASTATVRHTWLNSGSYPVNLTVTDDMGARTTISRTVDMVVANKAPVAAFTTTTEGLAVAVDGSASTDDGTVEAWAWDFGDGATATGATARHDYAAPGTYTIRLTVADDAGLRTTTSRQVIVLAAGGVVAADSFSQAETRWGTADVGGAWTYPAGGSLFRTDGSAGLVTLNAGAGATAALAGVSATDLTATADVTIDKVTTGGGVNLMLAGRRTGSSEYRAKLRLLSDGTARIAAVRVVNGTETVLKEAVVAGGYQAGRPLHLSLELTGAGTTTVLARAWSGETMPATGASATDASPELQSAGSVGVVGYASGSATTAPFTLAIDNLTVVKKA